MAYATTIDLASSAPSKALDGVTSDDQKTALARASAIADGYLSTRSTVPLTSWGADLTEAVCAIATYQLVARRPSAAVAGVFRTRYEDAMRWLRDVADGRVAVSGGVSVTPELPDADEYGADSDSERGW